MKEVYTCRNLGKTLRDLGDGEETINICKPTGVWVSCEGTARLCAYPEIFKRVLVRIIDDRKGVLIQFPQKKECYE